MTDETGTSTNTIATAAPTTTVSIAPPLLKPKITYVDQNDEPCSMAWAEGVRISVFGASFTFVPSTIVLDDNSIYRLDVARVRRLAIFGAAELMRQTAKHANAPIAEVEARFAKMTVDAWGDERAEKPKREKKVALTPEQKAALAIDELLDVVRVCKEFQGKPIADLAAARKKLLEGDPAKGISGDKFRRDLRKDPAVAAEIAKRKAALAPVAPVADGLEAL